jgi:hypothetical protein
VITASPSDEVGSDHHLDLTLITTRSWLHRDARLVGSGRNALFAAAAGLLGNDGILYIPTYFCHDVTSWLERHLPVKLFNHGPFEGESDLKIGPTDVALMVEYFGDRSSLTVEGGSVVVDRTHLPWANHSYHRRPDAVAASLRKALPLPDGGIYQFADSVHPEIEINRPNFMWEDAVSETMLGMGLKAQYLRSVGPTKQDFINRIKSVERHLVDASHDLRSSDFTRAFAGQFEVDAFDRKRRSNQELLCLLTTDIDESIGLTNTPSHSMLTFRSIEHRNAARDAMIARGVYPAILWDLSSRLVPDQQRRFADTTLFLAVDHRYGPRQIERLGSVITSLTGTG